MNEEIGEELVQTHRASVGPGLETRQSGSRALTLQLPGSTALLSSA